MSYIVENPDGILNQADGIAWSYGAIIGDNQIPPRWRQSLLDEGAIRELGIGRPNPPEKEDLTMIADVTEARQAQLYALGLMTIADVAGASDAILTRISGVGPVIAKKMRLSAHDLALA